MFPFPCSMLMKVEIMSHNYQLVLLVLALAAVPWMLLPKPFLLKKQYQEVCYWFYSFFAFGSSWLVAYIWLFGVMSL